MFRLLDGCSSYTTKLYDQTTPFFLHASCLSYIWRFDATDSPTSVYTQTFTFSSPKAFISNMIFDCQPQSSVFHFQKTLERKLCPNVQSTLLLQFIHKKLLYFKMKLQRSRRTKTSVNRKSVSKNQHRKLTITGRMRGFVFDLQVTDWEPYIQTGET